MKMIFLSLLFIFISINSAIAGEINVDHCNENQLVVIVTNPFGAKYLGVTATLTDGNYYDFEVGDVDVLNPGHNFTLPGLYKATSWEARLWNKKKKSKKSWSDKVVNPQDYLMEDPASDSVRCNP